MKRQLIGSGFDITITVGLMLAAFNAHAEIADLDWMSGCWALAGQDDGSVEQWSRPAGTTMLGFNRVVSDGKTVAFEYLRIIEDEDVGLVLIASPSGQETASFSLLNMSDNKVVFANPKHDFPQRIIFRLDDQGKLFGRIEGAIDGTARAVDFPMNRISCGDTDTSRRE